MKRKTESVRADLSISRPETTHLDARDSPLCHTDLGDLSKTFDDLCSAQRA
ncbi:Hypothetical predicted protein, partial [Marmota monax]